MRWALLAATCFALAFPVPGVAATFCVGADPACTGIQKGNDLAGAFDDASRLPGADRIQIAAGTFKLPAGGVSYAASDGVEVLGAGRGRTTILAPSGTALSLGGLGAAASTVRDLTINAPNEGYGIQTGGLVQRVEVIRVEGRPLAGVALEGAGRFLDGSVSVGGEAWSIVTSGSENRVADSVLGSGGGVAAVAGRVVVERVAIPRADEHEGLGVLGATMVARDVLVVVGKKPALTAVTTSGGDALLDASQMTLVSKESAPRAAASFSAWPGRLARVRVRNAIIFGFRELSRGYAENDGRVLIEIPSFLKPADTDPRFVDPASGDYRLRPDSPAIDAGEPGGLEPGESPTDLDGNPRIAGGRRDLGAYEYQPPDRTPPKVGIAPGSLPLLAGNVVRLRLACPRTESECAGVLRLRARRGGALLGSARFRLMGGQTRVLAVRLSAAGAARIRRLKVVAAIASVDARDAAGNRGRSQRALIIRSQRRSS